MPEIVATSDHKSLSPIDIVAVLTKMVQEQERTMVWADHESRLL